MKCVIPPDIHSRDSGHTSLRLPLLCVPFLANLSSVPSVGFHESWFVMLAPG